MNDHPNVIVIAGPNGAGKSSAAPELLSNHLRIMSFVNADVIARGLAGFAPETVNVAAGRIMLARLRELAAERRDFAFETTLASRTFAPWIAALCSSGFEFHLYYLWLDSADLAVERVRRRVESGGHSVPEDAVRRRFVRSAHNFFHLYRPIATSWRVFDNSAEPRLVAFGGASQPDTIVEAPIWESFRSVGHG